MFDKGYKFHCIDNQMVNDGFLVSVHKYNFRTKRRRYIAVVERYQDDIYVIKYHAEFHSKSKSKYSFVFNDEKPAPIIRTCIDIMLDFYSKNPSASFGFMGAASSNKKKKKKKISEGKANTQRFRIYRRTMVNFFGDKAFSHYMNKRFSAYLMINRKKAPIKKFKKAAEIGFSTHYQELDF